MAVRQRGRRGAFGGPWFRSKRRLVPIVSSCHCRSTSKGRGGAGHGIACGFAEDRDDFGLGHADGDPAFVRLYVIFPPAVANVDKPEKARCQSPQQITAECLAGS